MQISEITRVMWNMHSFTMEKHPQVNKKWDDDLRCTNDPGKNWRQLRCLFSDMTRSYCVKLLVMKRVD
jgi:hypothetical protein